MWYPNCPLCGHNPEVDIEGFTATPVNGGLEEIRCGKCKSLIGTVPSVNGYVNQIKRQLWTSAVAQYASTNKTPQ